MVRKLLATTALITLLSGAAFAQETIDAQPGTTAPEGQQAEPAAPVIKADGFLATNLIGETVYNGTGSDAENIGDVNDVVIGSNGQVESVVIGVGGFLGIGEKNIAMKYADLKWAEKDGDRWIVVNATKEQLEAQAAFDARPYQPTPPVTTDNTAMAPAPADNSGTLAPPAPADETAQAPAATDETTTAAIDRSKLTEIPAGDIRSEDLVGTIVYGANDTNLGEIGDVILTQDGKVDAVIVDVGGFLGVGEKEVAVGMDNLVFMSDADGNKYLYTTFTKEQLDAAAAYDKSTWAEKRDEQRVMMQ